MSGSARSTLITSAPSAAGHRAASVRPRTGRRPRPGRRGGATGERPRSAGDVGGCDAVALEHGGDPEESGLIPRRGYQLDSKGKRAPAGDGNGDHGKADEGKRLSVEAEHGSRRHLIAGDRDRV